MNETPNIRVAPTVRVLSYRTTDRAAVQAFVDIEIDALWRLNGVNLLRDGSLKPGQLTPLIGHRRCYIDSIRIIDEAVRKQWETAILAAIRAHLETLLPDQQVKPPRPPELRQTDKQPAVVTARAKPSPGNATTKLQNAQVKSASGTTSAPPIKPKPINTNPPAAKPIVPPPARLLANFPKRTTP
jgi:hypothetical protein